MDARFRSIKLRKFKHRITPVQRDIQEFDYRNFTFADWQPTAMKRSPTCPEISQKSMVKEFYKREQVKLAKIHRSSDNRKKSTEELDEMKYFMKKIMSQYSELNKRSSSGEKALKRNECQIKDLEGENKTTHYFIKSRNRVKFPRDVFSPHSNKFRNYSHFNKGLIEDI